MRIKERREALGLTRTQLGDRLGVSKVAVRKWELGLAMPNADKLPALGRPAPLLHRRTVWPHATPGGQLRGGEEG